MIVPAYENETKTLRLYVYVGPRLRDAIDKCAELDGRERSDWMRRVVCEKVRETLGREDPFR